MMHYAAPTPTGLHPLSIISLAEKLSIKTGGDQYFLDERSTVRALGGRIVEKETWLTGEEVLDSLIVENVRDFEVHVSHSALQNHKKFAICHEIGHYVLHYMYNKRHDRGIEKLKANMNRESSIVEREANLFACALSMPRQYILSVLEDASTPMYEYRVADKFGVPVRNAKRWIGAIQDRWYQDDEYYAVS